MTDARLLDALRSLERTIAPPPPGTALGNWRWSVRQRLTALRDALAETDLGLALRERSALMARVRTLASDVLERPDLEDVRGELRRLVVDVHHLASQAARA